MSSALGFVGKTWALAAKDLKIEGRGRATLPPMLAFALTVTLLLAFTVGDQAAGARIDVPFVPGAVELAVVLAGYLWVTVLFAGLISFARSFEVDRDEAALDILLLLPIDRSALFVSKAVANLTSIMLVEALLIPLFAILFEVHLGARWALFAAVLALVDVGFVAIGTLFAAVAAQTRSRELMLPILALPALVPVFIGAVELTAALLRGATGSDVVTSGWFGLLAGFDVIFAVVGALAFEFVLD